MATAATRPAAPAKKATAAKKVPAKPRAAPKPAEAEGVPGTPSAPWATDDVVAKAKANVREILSGADPDKMIDDITALHKRMKTRKLITLRGLGSDTEAVMIDANLENQAIRSSMAEIDITAVVIRQRAKDVIEMAGDYVRETYGAHLNEVGRTQADRQAVLDAIFLSSQRVMRGLALVATVADKALKDVDQAAFRLSGAQNALIAKTGGRK